MLTEEEAQMLDDLLECGPVGLDRASYLRWIMISDWHHTMSEMADEEKQSEEDAAEHDMTALPVIRPTSN
jgi:hypothetical protein